MMNSVMSKTELGKIDGYIRNMINEMIGGPALSNDLFYTSWKFGGFGRKKMTERYEEYKFNALSYFFQRDQEMKKLIDLQINKERKITLIQKEQKTYFFDLDLPNA
jgi:hypothetical protein